MEERLRFVARRLEGESMTALCRGFGISRKTGHKIFAVWKPSPTGRGGRGGWRTGCRCPVEAAIVGLRRAHPSWGARKLRELLARRLGPDVPVPAAPNDLWCADFKGEFRLGNGRLCYPLTHRPGFALHPHGRGAGGDGGKSCIHGLPPAVRGARPACRDPLR